jgi:hypothetical protein
LPQTAFRVGCTSSCGAVEDGTDAGTRGMMTVVAQGVGEVGASSLRYHIY